MSRVQSCLWPWRVSAVENLYFESLWVHKRPELCRRRRRELLQTWALFPGRACV